MDRRSFINTLGIAGFAGASGLAADFSEANSAAHAQQSELYLPVIAGEGSIDGSLLVAASDAPESVKSIANYVCSGTDDQEEINGAIAEAGELGGQIRLSAGSFNCSSAIRLTRRVALTGRGKATVLRAEGTWAAFDGSTTGAVIEPANDGIDKTMVSQLAIDGNRYQGADVGGIYYNITRKDDFDEGPDAGHTFSDIYIFRTRQHGFHLTGGHMRASHVGRIRVYNVGEEGVNEAHGFLIDCPDGFYTQCESGSSSGSGFYVDNGNNRFTNCKSWYSDLSGWQIRKPRNQFAACESQDNQEHGFYITTGPTSLVGCHADSNSWNPDSPTADFDGFHIPWGIGFS